MTCDVSPVAMFRSIVMFLLDCYLFRSIVIFLDRLLSVLIDCYLFRSIVIFFAQLLSVLLNCCLFCSIFIFFCKIIYSLKYFALWLLVLFFLIVLLPLRLSIEDNQWSVIAIIALHWLLDCFLVGERGGGNVINRKLSTKMVTERSVYFLHPARALFIKRVIYHTVPLGNPWFILGPLL